MQGNYSLCLCTVFAFKVKMAQSLNVVLGWHTLTLFAGNVTFYFNWWLRFTKLTV